MSDSEERVILTRNKPFFQNFDFKKYKDKLVNYNKKNELEKKYGAYSKTNDNFDKESLEMLVQNNQKDKDDTFQKRKLLLEEKYKIKRQLRQQENNDLRREINDYNIQCQINKDREEYLRKQRQLDEERDQLLRKQRDNIVKQEKEKFKYIQDNQPFDCITEKDKRSDHENFYKRGTYNENLGVYNRHKPTFNIPSNNEHQEEKFHQKLKDEDNYRYNMDLLNIRLHNLEQNVGRKDRFEQFASGNKFPKVERDISPTGVSITHARNTLDEIVNYINASNINPENVYDQKERIKQMNKAVGNYSLIGKFQFDENQENSRNKRFINSDDFTPIWIDKSIGSYNVDKCSDKIKTCKNQVMSIKNIGFQEFIDQFELCDFTDCSQFEFNQIVHNCLPKDLKDKVELTGIIPAFSKSKDYLNLVRETLNDGPISCYDVDTMLEKFKPTKQNNILEIYQEYKQKINNLPDSIVKKSEKDRRIHGQMIKYLPNTILSILKSDEANYGGPFTPEKLKRFLTMHQQVINWHLQNRRKNQYFKKTRVNKIDIESDDENEEEIDQIDNYESDDFDNLSIDDFYGPTRVNKIERRKNRQMNFNGMKCNNCKRLRHTEERCIFNLDPEVRYRNQKRIELKVCLKCRSSKHLDKDCKIFEKFTIEQCERCKKNGNYEYHHLVDECIQNNFLEKNMEGS